MSEDKDEVIPWLSCARKLADMDNDQKISDKASIVGKQIGRYQLVEQIGQGGMGVVFKAFDVKLERTVALKILLTTDESNKLAVERFIQEGKATARLEHPNIIKIYDVGDENGLHYFAMELVVGSLLKQYLKENKPPLKQKLHIMLKICEALHYAHEQGIIHRDLKPGNIFIDNNLEPKILDFGLAKVVDTEKKLSKTGMVLGTLQYMSPEQAQGRTRDIDARSDVYGLGAILYEMLTGIPPFSGSSWNILYKVLQELPTAPRKIKQRLPKDIEEICLKVLSKKKKQRYQTAQELAMEISHFLEGKKKPRKLNKKICAIIVILLITSISIGYAFSSRQKKQQAKSLFAKKVSTKKISAKKKTQKETPYKKAKDYLNKIKEYNKNNKNLTKILDKVEQKLGKKYLFIAKDNCRDLSKWAEQVSLDEEGYVMAKETIGFIRYIPAGAITNGLIIYRQKVYDGGLIVASSQNAAFGFGLVARSQYQDIYWMVRKNGKWLQDSKKSQQKLVCRAGEVLEIAILIDDDLMIAFVNGHLKSSTRRDTVKSGFIHFYSYNAKKQQDSIRGIWVYGK